MNAEAIPLADEAQWHALRAKHVGASEVAALFDVHPHLTKFELWHQKKGDLPAPDLSDNDRVFWGNTLEPAIAKGIAEKKGWEVRKVRRYLSKNGMGASLDYEVRGTGRGMGVLQIKNVDSLQYRQWEDGQPPLHFELQVQQEIALAGYSWGALGALVGGNYLPDPFERDRHDGTITRLEAEVAAFWQSIADGKEPALDPGADLEAVKALYRAVAEGKLVEFPRHNRLPVLCAEYKAAAADAKTGEARKEAALAEIISIIKDADTALTDGWRIKSTTIPGGPVAYERKAYRKLTITALTPKG